MNRYPSSAVYPVICYQDGPGALRFLAEALGFTVLSEHRGEDGSLVHGEARIGDGVVMLSTKRASDPANPWSAVEFGTYVYIEHIKDHYDGARAAGADIVMDLRDTDYGSREYSVRDPQGRLWSFGTYRPGS